MLFKFPYYVSPHAVERFRDRVAFFSGLHEHYIRLEIQKQLQSDKRELLGFVRWDKQVNPAYMGRFKGRKYIIPTQMDLNKTGEVWPTVPTILPLNSMNNMHWERNNGERKWLDMLEEFNV